MGRIEDVDEAVDEDAGTTEKGKKKAGKGKGKKRAFVNVA